MFEVARRAGVRRVVYASSSSVYGDEPTLPKQEDQPPAPVSPCAVSKVAGEQYGRVWHRIYGLGIVGLRYFNVFGPRQDPTSEYATVIPRFVLQALAGSRPTCWPPALPASRARCSTWAAASASACFEVVARLERILGRPIARRHTPPRTGDVPHTLADIGKAKRMLGYSPLVDFEDGLARTVEHFRRVHDAS